jgi:hypothetical protein
MVDSLGQIALVLVPALGRWMVLLICVLDPSDVGGATWRRWTWPMHRLHVVLSGHTTTLLFLNALLHLKSSVICIMLVGVG